MKIGMSAWGGVAMMLLGMATAAAAPRAPSVDEACRSVPEGENHLAVLLSAADVLRVDPLTAREHATDPTVPSGEGARITVAAQPFVTAAWLNDVVTCHLARNAAAKPPAESRSPLDVAGATISVTSSPGTLTLNVATSDRDGAREILRRSQALRPAH